MVTRIFPHTIKFLQENMILDVMEEVGLEVDKVYETKAFITQSFEEPTSFGGYRFSKVFMMGLPQMMNNSSIPVFIWFIQIIFRTLYEVAILKEKEISFS